VLVYELLFGEGLRRKGRAEKAVVRSEVRSEVSSRCLQ
jgi:hypothetical protein